MRGIVAALGLLLVLVASACGGSSGSSGTTGTTTASTSPATEKARVEQVWTRFFAASTPASQKIALLQNGSAFASAIRAQSRSPLASRSSAKVSNVTLESARKARVVYTIDLAGQPALEHQTGTAVEVGGAWKVGDASFCKLLGLQGPAPKACSQSG